jgi:hypothetical protein
MLYHQFSVIEVTERRFADSQPWHPHSPRFLPSPHATLPQRIRQPPSACQLRIHCKEITQPFSKFHTAPAPSKGSDHTQAKKPIL